MVFLRPDVIVVMIFLIGLAGSFFVVRWVFKPLHEAEISPRPRSQFFTSDFFALLLPLMLAGAALSQSHTNNFKLYTSDPVNILTATVCAGIFWWRGTVLLSGAAVTDAWRRFVFLALINPLAFAGGIAAIVSPLLVSYLFINRFSLVGALIGVILIPAWLGISAAILSVFRLTAPWVLKDRATA